MKLSAEVSFPFGVMSIFICKNSPSANFSVRGEFFALELTTSAFLITTRCSPI